ncbi:MAG: T9SS type A sorting domain-containing protein [Candidatus Kapabacteria bacterium]|nr:T9SS type A sorting domain-containing protein [Candidatus Kapabacteria bacterium]
MKTVCVLLALVGITTTFCFSQTPVPLEEWLVSKGYPDSSISPPMIVGVTDQFSVINGFRKDPSKQSIVIGKIQPKTFKYTIETWMNRFQGDTLNEFTWGSGLHPEGIISLDMNGDGNIDYLNSGGRLFMGTSDGVPDTTKRYVFPTHPHIRAGSRKNTYGDINADGKDDIFYYHHASSVYPYLITLIFGSEDMSSIRTTKVSSPLLADSSMHEVSVVLYKNKQNKWRLITYTYGIEFIPIPPPGRLRGIPEFASIRMYDVSIQPKQDSNVVTLTLLDTYKDSDWLNSQFYLNATSPVNTDGRGAIYFHRQVEKLFLYAITSTYQNTTFEVKNPIFDITNDRFTVIDKGTIGGVVANGVVLDNSLDGDNINDICDVWTDGVVIYSIDNYGKPIKKYSWYDKSNQHAAGIADVYTLGDVSGDGISDFALLMKDSRKGNTFVIIQGKDWKTVGVQDEHSTLPNIGEPFPVPTNKDVLQIPISINDKGEYNLLLYSLQGTLIQEIWKSTNAVDSINVVLNTSALSAGVYVLRLTNEIIKAEKLITITK